MDNRLNKSRRKIKVLRVKMRELEHAMRAAIAAGGDCTAPAQSLMDRRREMARLVGERAALGDTTPVILNSSRLVF
jgi:hypothetical protein